MITDRTRFFEIQSEFDNIPFTQTEEWLLSVYSNKLNDVVYYVDSIEDAHICCWGVHSKKPFFGKHLLINGETYNKDISIKKTTSFYREIVDVGYTVVKISSINFYNPNYEIGIRRAGFIRPLALSPSPVTLLVNLQEPFNFHRNWKRSVQKSIKASIQFQHIEKPTIKDIETFIILFNQLKERKNLGFKLSEKGLASLLKHPKFKLFFVYDKDRHPISGRIVYVNNKRSYDIYAANSEQALQCGAAYFIQQKILEFLRDLEVELFDYGRVPPGTDQMDSIYISKSYSGGYPASYNAQWIFSKGKLFDLMYTIVKHYIRGDKRY